MYIVKVKGKARIPDHLQIRDQDFNLVAYFKCDTLQASLEKFKMGHLYPAIALRLPKLAYGVIEKIEP